MKDPLQVEETPYEILAVGEEATDGDIDLAFRTALAGGDAQRVTRAWQTLKRPQDRAFLDVFRYSPASLRALSPCPLDDPTALDPPRREATATAWEEILRSRYPDLGVIHSLAVLWYWWAIREESLPRPVVAPTDEDGQAGLFPEEAPEGGSLHAVGMWERAVGCWSTLLESEAFWSERPRMTHGLAEELDDRIDRTMRERFDAAARKHRRSAEAERYRSLELALSTERRTARILARSGIRTARGPVCSGPLLLGRLGLRGEVARMVDEVVAATPREEGLRFVRDSLSSYSRISTLIEAGRAGEAVAEIGKLPSELRRTDEVASIHARALLALGRQEAELGRGEEAIEQWAMALEAATSEEERAAARSAIVTTARERTAALGASHRDEAVALLERAGALVDDHTLVSTLAELLFERGVETINAAQEAAAAAGAIEKPILKDMRRGLHDLERAERFGSRRAGEQARLARDLVDQAGTHSLVARANAAAEKEDWDEAVKLLRQAVEQAGGETQETLRSNLAVSLASRAMKSANAAFETRRVQREVRLDPVDRWEQESCRLRCGSRATHLVRVQEAEGPLGTAKFGEGMPMCAEHAEEMRSMLAAPVTVRPGTDERIALLESARKDMDEASRLAPGLKAIRERRKELAKLLRQVKARERPGKARRLGRGATKVGRGAGELAGLLLKRAVLFAAIAAVVATIFAFVGGFVGPAQEDPFLQRWVAVFGGTLLFSFVVWTSTGSR
ncbi:MAG: hypothetical protein HY658_05580 [Actinobacteria bacterium]|nr:hypothetical protein [Actinomycetota bacterium]